MIVNVHIGYVRRSNNIKAVVKTDSDVHRSRLYHNHDELVIYINVLLFFM